MTIYITDCTDIPISATIVLPFKNPEEIVGGGREGFRKSIADFFETCIASGFSDKCRVRFDDEVENDA